MGYADPVKAPRGYGKEWAARLYCERAISRADYLAHSHHTKKQYRCGSYNARRQSLVWQHKQYAWEQGIEWAKAIVAAAPYLPDETWADRKEQVKEAFEYSSYLLVLAGD